MKSFLLYFTALAAIFTPIYSFAGKGIPSPYVKKGKHSFTTDGYFSIDETERKDGDYRTRFSFDGGLTDRLAYRARFTGEEKGGKDYRFTQAELGFKYQLAEEGVLPVDLALYATYDIRSASGKADQLNLRFIYGKKWNNIHTWGNIIIEPEIGENSYQTDLQIRHRLQYFPKFNLQIPASTLELAQNAWYIGADYYGDYGDIDRIDDSSDNSHQVGAFFGTYIPGTKLKSEFSYVTEVSGTTSDHLLKWKFTYNF